MNILILFKPEHVNPILNGVKTETRRLWKSARVKVGSIQLAKTQMLSKDYFAKLHILNVYQERLGDITPESAMREGGYTIESYFAKFDEINGTTDRNTILYVVHFEVIQ